MDKITKISPLINPKFIKPMLIEYEQKGVKKLWEAVESHDAVSILLWHKQKNAFILVKQLRPAVFNANPRDGYMYELCAGIVDKELSLKEIAQEEILEECGYDIPLDSISKISSFYTSVGMSGAAQTLYYAQVEEHMYVNAGGGLNDEEIEVIYLSVTETKKFMFDESFQKTPGMMMAFYWWFENKAS